MKKNKFTRFTEEEFTDKFTKELLERGVNFEYIKKLRKVGDLKKLYNNFEKQLKQLPKKAKTNNQLTKLSIKTIKKISI